MFNIMYEEGDFIVDNCHNFCIQNLSCPEPLNKIHFCPLHNQCPQFLVFYFSPRDKVKSCFNKAVQLSLLIFSVGEIDCTFPIRVTCCICFKSFSSSQIKNIGCSSIPMYHLIDLKVNL